jgi:serine/threonine protein phosphatase PrpC
VWRHIAQSLQGPSHLKDETPCQDTHRVQVIGEGASSTLIACVADGAGSAKCSDEGSAIACNTIIEKAVLYFDSNSGFDGLELAEMVRWCEEIRSRIRNVAGASDRSFRDFASTLCVAIVGPEMSYFLQLGDGAIILGNDSLYGIVFWPQMGEYANSTNFLTSDEYQNQLEFTAAKSSCSKIALMTDGLERLALKFNSQTPHTPFFEPLFRALQSTADVDSLNSGLRSFLTSDSIHNRTDDDKTLILATRCSDSVA